MHRLATAVLSSCLMMAPLLAAAQVNSLPSQPHLLVRGKGEREVVPDRFRLSVQLLQTDAVPETARARVQADAATTLGLFKDNGALTDSIEASSISIEPERRYVDNREIFVGTRVSRTLSATFSRLQQVRTVLAGLKTSDHVQVSGITTAYSDEARIRGELKREAVQQTRTTASNLAQAYGVRLGGLYTISEVAPDFPYGIRAGSWGSGTGGGFPAPAPREVGEARTADKLKAQAESLEAGSITLTEYVYAIFLIAP